jgi:hypothetical protein
MSCNQSNGTQSIPPVAARRILRIEKRGAFAIIFAANEIAMIPCKSFLPQEQQQEFLASRFRRKNNHKNSLRIVVAARIIARIPCQESKLLQ